MRQSQPRGSVDAALAARGRVSRACRVAQGEPLAVDTGPVVGLHDPEDVAVSHQRAEQGFSRDPTLSIEAEIHEELNP